MGREEDLDGKEKKGGRIERIEKERKRRIEDRWNGRRGEREERGGEKKALHYIPASGII